MKPNERAYISQQDPFAMNNPGYYGSPYPGIGNPYAGSSPNLPVPANPQAPAGFPVAAAEKTTGGAAGSFNFGQLKGIIDRMGGIDGIMGTMGKVQRIVQNFRQMAPMFKLLMGSFGSKAATAKAGDGLSWPQKSRKRKRRYSAQSRRKGKKSYGSKSRALKGTKKK